MKSRQRPQLIDRVDVINGRAHVTVWRSITPQLVEIEGLSTIAQRYERLLLPLPLHGAEGLTGPPGAPWLVDNLDAEKPWALLQPRAIPTSKRRSAAAGALITDAGDLRSFGATSPKDALT